MNGAKIAVKAKSIATIVRGLQKILFVLALSRIINEQRAGEETVEVVEEEEWTKVTKIPGMIM